MQRRIGRHPIVLPPGFKRHSPVENYSVRYGMSKGIGAQKTLSLILGWPFHRGLGIPLVMQYGLRERCSRTNQHGCHHYKELSTSHRHLFATIPENPGILISCNNYLFQSFAKVDMYQRKTDAKVFLYSNKNRIRGRH